MKTYCITAKEADLSKIVKRKRKEGLKCYGKPVKIGGGFVVQPMIEKIG